METRTRLPCHFYFTENTPGARSAILAVTLPDGQKLSRDLQNWRKVSADTFAADLIIIDCPESDAFLERFVASSRALLGSG